MRTKIGSILLISILSMVVGLFAGCGDEERAATDQPDRTEALIDRDEIRENEEENIVRREEIQEEQQVAQEKMAVRQNPEASIPMPSPEREEGVVEEPKGPRGERKVAGADRPDTLPPENETIRIDADLIGKQVHSAEGEKLGNVVDTYRGAGGSVDYVLVKSIDKRLYPVPMNLVRQGARSMGLELAIDRQAFKKAPSLKETEGDRLYESEFDGRVRTYYRNQTPGEDGY